MSPFQFELLATDGEARLGRLQTAHGPIDTPAFMPVGTAATVKAMTNDMVRATGAQVILGNTYHLMVRPGAERIAKLGGLHKFMNWPAPILTDSGGFQVMSLQGLRQINDHAVTFASHLDGKRFELTPERSVEIQDMLDSTITMVLDQCVPAASPKTEVETAMERSMAWAERSRAAFRQREGYGLFGIVQGGTDRTLRQKSASRLVDIGFDGYAIGGLAVGEPQDVMFDTIGATAPILPRNRPRYLMGVGKPSDIVGAVARGVDMFDCVLPTRSGRTAQAWVRGGFLNLRNACHAEDPAPLDLTCVCETCRSHSRAYLHHLIKAKEILGSILLTWHNIHFYQALMRRDARGHSGRWIRRIPSITGHRSEPCLTEVTAIIANGPPCHLDLAARMVMITSISGAKARVAQLAEQLTFNQRVPGSSPGARTNKINRLGGFCSQNFRHCRKLGAYWEQVGKSILQGCCCS